MSYLGHKKAATGEHTANKIDVSVQRMSLLKTRC